jgi:hypothetical protein
MKKYIFLAYILGVGTTILFFYYPRENRQENKPPIFTVSAYWPKPLKETVIDIQYRDTGSREIVIDRIPYPVPFYIPVDSAAIVRDYLTLRNYVIDTTAADIHAFIKWDLYANHVLKYDIQFENLKKCPEETNKFGVGLLTGYKEVTPLVLFARKKMSYLAGYNIYENQFKVGFIYTFK